MPNTSSMPNNESDEFDSILSNKRISLTADSTKHSTSISSRRMEQLNLQWIYMEFLHRELRRKQHKSLHGISFSMLYRASAFVPMRSLDSI